MLDLETFFEEKQVPFTQWEIEHDGTLHIINSDVVIESILSTKGGERIKIACMLFMLDINNASIVDYLHFLAKAIIANNT